MCVIEKEKERKRERKKERDREREHLLSQTQIVQVNQRNPWPTQGSVVSAGGYISSIQSHRLCGSNLTNRP